MQSESEALFHTMLHISQLGHCRDAQGAARLAVVRGCLALILPGPCAGSFTRPAVLCAALHDVSALPLSRGLLEPARLSAWRI